MSTVQRSSERVVIEPQPTPLTEPYWEAARRGVVALQRCTSCGATWHPPQPTCPACRSAAVEWFDSAGRGVVHAFTVVHHATHPAVAGRTPYVVALIELVEGPTVVCNVLDVAPDAVAVGMPVELRLGDAPAGARLPEAFPAAPVSPEPPGAA